MCKNRKGFEFTSITVLKMKFGKIMQNESKVKKTNFEKILIVVNTCKEESTKLSLLIKDFLIKRNFLVESVDFDGFSKDFDFSKYKFVVTLGGDGTVLYAARNCVLHGIPVFPINLGEFGFLASVQPCDWEDCLSCFIEGSAPVEMRSMMNVCIERNQKCVYSSLSLNDVVIASKTATSVISLSIEQDSLPLCKIKADGLILSTPTGSTAYSASAGGPIISPDLDVFLLTPLNSFSLSSRPIVLNPDKEIIVSSKSLRSKEIIVTVDGQKPFTIKENDKIKINKLSQKILLAYCSSEQFNSTLRSKLNWSGGPHA